MRVWICASRPKFAGKREQTAICRLESEENIRRKHMRKHMAMLAQSTYTTKPHKPLQHMNVCEYICVCEKEKKAEI